VINFSATDKYQEVTAMNVKPHITVVLFLFCLIGVQPSYAREWMSAQPVGPAASVKGMAAVKYSGKQYVFAAAGPEIVYRATSDGGQWYPSTNWSSLAEATDAAPAAAMFQNKLYLFFKAKNSPTIYYRIYDGQQWSQKSSLAQIGATAFSPGAAAHDNKLYVFITDAAGNIRYKYFDGINWIPAGSAATLAASSTNAPAAISFSGRLYVFAQPTDGSIHYSIFPSAAWSKIDSFSSAASPTAAISNDKLFLFAKAKDRSIWYRVLDRSHGRDDWLPVDAWMRAGQGLADSGLAAGALDDRLFVFYPGLQTIPQVAPYLTSQPSVMSQRADWSRVPMVLLQGADNPQTGGLCPNAADLTGFDNWIRFANSVYAPALIHFDWTATHQVCDSTVNQESVNAGALDKEAQKYYPGNLVVLVRKSTGGGSSGCGATVVIVPEYNNSPIICGHGRFNNDLAHEIGHYFCLAHTFHDNPQDSGIVPKTQNEVQQMLKAAGFDPVVAFDHDYLENEISDTPPDPYWETQGGTTSKCLTTPINLVGKNGETVSFNPPRTNVMSYYEPTADSIQKLSAGQIRVIYRRLFERGFH
jgi:hypothetical protein